MNLYVILIGLVVCVSAVNGTVILEPLSTLYLPYLYDENDEPLYALGKTAAEQTAYDPNSQLVYVVGDSVINIVDISDVYSQKIVYYTNIDSIATDIEVCGDYVAMTISAEPKIDPGKVVIYDLYDPDTETWNLVQSVTVGSLPDMLQFTKDCQTIVVCDEGEHGEDSDGDYVDPEGSVTIIKFTSKDLSQEPSIHTANFTAFNDRTEEYIAKGVRAPLMGQLAFVTSTFSQNMEPEYAALNEDDTVAYIALQENNAIAEVDIATATVTEIHPLGFKDNVVYGFDASDRDFGINMQPWPIYGMYQPDAIKYFHIDGQGYLVTANEGDSMEVSFGSEEWSEQMRGQDFVTGGYLSDLVSEDLAAALGDDTKLGRLLLSIVDGMNVSDPTKYDQFYTYGSRSFSVIQPSDMSMLYDSGDEFEQICAENYPTIFNMNSANRNFDETPEDTMDTRSDNKGPEPESVAYGKVGDTNILFIGLERISSIMLYQISDGVVTFESVYRAGGIDDTFQNLYDARNIGDSDPEDIRFIDKSDSPNNRPLLLVAGTHSGTLSLYDVIDDVIDEMDTDVGSSSLISGLLLLVCLPITILH
ncbi:mesenchyme-specific cell surface glycoprotein-like [Glandiceps talaboti]